jgi:CheY-like chemotaxis protein
MSILSVGSMGLADDSASLASAATAGTGNNTSLSVNGNSGNLIIMVSDNGPGISEVNQKKLFRSVIQFDPEKNQGGGGSGFGLFISKGIVDLHNGSISVRSEGEGHGCSFILAMPMVRRLSDPLEESEPPIPSGNGDPRTLNMLNLSAKSNASSEKDRRNSLLRRSSIAAMMDWAEQHFSSARGLLSGSVENVVPLTGRHGEDLPPLSSRETPRKRYRLLIVDDSGLSRKMLCKAMRSAGHESDEAGDGLIALNRVKEKLADSSMYDAILMDRNMPVMDGPSAAKAIRDLGVTVPIFGVTGDGEDNDIDYFKSHGATAVLVKPMDMNEFLRYMDLLT